MSNSVIARQKGDNYQAKFFWRSVCGMFRKQSSIQAVSWELKGPHGFDDVVVHYSPAKIISGTPIIQENYQIKFHVDHDKAFTCDNLMDPQFIGNQTESILARLYKNYLSNTTCFESSLYCIYNIWTLDHTDHLRKLLDNNGLIRLSKLKEGGENSKTGIIRKKWKDHLGIADDEILYKVLSRLRIEHSAPNEDRLKEELNIRLSYSKLKPIQDYQESDQYTSLIQALHSNGRNTFTKDELDEIFQREGLWDLEKEENKEEDVYKVGFRSFKMGAEDLDNDVDLIGCFLHCFQGRFISSEYADLQYIKSEIESISQTIISRKKKTIIHLDTHTSLAFLSGYFLDHKFGGIDITIVQKTPMGKLLWAPDIRNPYQSDGSCWNCSIKEYNCDGNEIAVSIDITRDTKWDVENHVTAHLPNVKHHYQATINPKIGSTAIQNANHAIAAIEELIAEILLFRRKNSLTGVTHIFLAGPNVIAFYLGQRSRIFKNISLYEFDFAQERDGGYHSILSI